MKRVKSKISNKLSYTLIAIVALILIGAGVYAYGTSSPSTMGHTFGEIAPPSGCTAGQALTWTGSAWTCQTVLAGVTQVFNSTYFCDSTRCYSQTYCPSGRKAISGGCITSDVSQVLLATSTFSSSSGLYGWTCTFVRPSSGPTSLSSFALCTTY